MGQYISYYLEQYKARCRLFRNVDKYSNPSINVRELGLIDGGRAALYLDHIDKQDKAQYRLSSIITAIATLLVIYCKYKSG